MSFEIYQSVGNGLVKELPLPDLDPSLNYRFKVVAVNKEGQSPFSNVVEWGALRPEGRALWTSQGYSILNSIALYPSAMPKGYWVANLRTSTVTEIYIDYFDEYWAGGATLPIQTLLVPYSELTGHDLPYGDGGAVTLYPLNVNQTHEPGMLIKYIEGSGEVYLFALYLDDTISWVFLNLPVESFLTALDPDLTDAPVDLIAMEDGLLLLKSGNGNWGCRRVDSAITHFSTLVYANTTDVLLCSGVDPIPNRGNAYPISLETASVTPDTYSELITYKVGDPVSYGGNCWVALQASIGVTPEEGAEWQRTLVYTVGFLPLDHYNSLGEVITSSITSVYAPYLPFWDTTASGLRGIVTPLENVIWVGFTVTRQYSDGNLWLWNEGLIEGGITTGARELGESNVDWARRLMTIYPYLWSYFAPSPQYRDFRDVPATGSELDYGPTGFWGNILGIVRLSGESDGDYTARMISETLNNTVNATMPVVYDQDNMVMTNINYWTGVFVIDERAYVYGFPDTHITSAPGTPSTSYSGIINIHRMDNTKNTGMSGTFEDVGINLWVVSPDTYSPSSYNYTEVIPVADPSNFYGTPNVLNSGSIVISEVIGG